MKDLTLEQQVKFTEILLGCEQVEEEGWRESSKDVVIIHKGKLVYGEAWSLKDCGFPEYEHLYSQSFRDYKPETNIEQALAIVQGLQRLGIEMVIKSSITIEDVIGWTVYISENTQYFGEELPEVITHVAVKEWFNKRYV